MPPLSRRTIHQPGSGSTSHGVREFFVRFVKPSFVFPAPSDGKLLFVCKKPCFAKLEQGMSKVTAVENIIRELHGPAGATISLSVTTGPGKASTVVVSASTQTDR